MKISGIYIILNTKNSHIYVGSAVDIERRWREHRNDLRTGRHHSQHLQKAFNKYGEDVFSFSIIYKCPPDSLIEMEQKYMDDLRPEYNICPTARSPLGIVRSEETRKKMSDQAKNRTEEHRTKLSDSTKLWWQKNKSSPITRKDHGNYKLANADVISVIDDYKSGNHSYNTLSKKYKISSSGIRKIIKGQTWGWLTGVKS
jgi:group I intron endonuclease